MSELPSTGPSVLYDGSKPPRPAPAAPVAAGYKVSAPGPTQLVETVPFSMVIASGLSAAIAIAFAVLNFLKY